MKVICEFCKGLMREIKPKNNPKIIMGACDGCYCINLPQEYLDKQIREAGDNPPPNDR